MHPVRVVPVSVKKRGRNKNAEDGKRYNQAVERPGIPGFRLLALFLIGFGG
jgi:hypothetical protein